MLDSFSVGQLINRAIPVRTHNFAPWDICNMQKSVLPARIENNEKGCGRGVKTACRLTATENVESVSLKSFGFPAENLLCSMQLIADTVIKLLKK